MGVRALGAVFWLLVGCAGPGMVLTERGWQLDQAPYRILTDESGQLAPPGWVLTNYLRLGRGQLRKRAAADETDVSLAHPVDEGLATLERLDGVESDTPLSTVAGRFLEREQEENLRTRDLAGVRVVLPCELRVIGQSAFEVGGGNGGEWVAQRFCAGNRQPEGTVYLALLRPRTGRLLLRLVYRNRPTLFSPGLRGIRGLARRIVFEGAEAPPASEVPPLCPAAPVPGEHTACSSESFG